MLVLILNKPPAAIVSDRTNYIPGTIVYIKDYLSKQPDMSREVYLRDKNFGIIKNSARKELVEYIYTHNRKGTTVDFELLYREWHTKQSINFHQGIIFDEVGRRYNFDVILTLNHLKETDLWNIIERG